MIRDAISWTNFKLPIVETVTITIRNSSVQSFIILLLKAKLFAIT